MVKWSNRETGVAMGSDPREVLYVIPFGESGFCPPLQENFQIVLWDDGSAGQRESAGKPPLDDAGYRKAAPDSEAAAIPPTPSDL